MATGFVYVVATVGKDYLQRNFRCVPTWFDGCIYFGPCKKPMRPRMRPGDYVFGISPAATFLRRIVFAAKIVEKMRFVEAYKRYPKLRGPDGPIHVRPARIPGATFPDSEYEHIPGANHEGKWRDDIRTSSLDAFFVCEPEGPCTGRWLGPAGPAVRGEVLEFLKSCDVYGPNGILSRGNADASEGKPVRHGNLFTGLHLETSAPKKLLALVCGAPGGLPAGKKLEPRPQLKPSSKRPTDRGRRTC